MEINIEELKKIKVNSNEILFIKVPNNLSVFEYENLRTEIIGTLHLATHNIILHAMELNPVVMKKEDAKKLVKELNKRIA